MLRRACFALLVVLSTAASAYAQSVRISLPAAVSFAASTGTAVTGNPSPSIVTFDTALLLPGQVLRMSVKADSATFIGPDGASFPVSLISWTVSNVSGGTASPGTLSADTYTQIFQSNILTVAGGFDVDWTLASVAGVSRAGNHALTLRWKIEAVFP